MFLAMGGGQPLRRPEQVIRAMLRQLLPFLALGLAPTLTAEGDEWAILDSPGNRLLKQNLLEQVREAVKKWRLARI